MTRQIPRSVRLAGAVTQMARNVAPARPAEVNATSYNRVAE